MKQLRGQKTSQCVRPVRVRRGVLSKQVSSRELACSDRTLRIRLVFGFLLLVSSVLVIRLFALQSKEHQRWLRLAAEQHNASIQIQPARNPIVDSQGRLLAVSVPRLSVAAHKGRKLSLRHQAELAEKLEMDLSEVSARLTSKPGFVWLKRGLPYEKLAELRRYERYGLTLLREYSRDYPQGNLAGAVLGRVSRDGDGQAGAELAFDKALSQGRFRVPVNRDARGRLIATPELPNAWDSFTGARFIPASYTQEQGREVQLSIDAAIQSIVEEELALGVRAASAKGGLAVVMDADSGELIALAENPSYDPNTKSIASLNELQSAALQHSYEPGSTMKPLIAALALQHRVMSMKKIIDCEKGSYRVGKHRIRDVHPLKRVSFRQALVESSNVAFAKVGQRLGRERLHEGLSRFGFGSKTGVELPGEASGILRGLKNWHAIDEATHAFGHGISVTPLQMLRAYAAVVNGGLLPTPTVRRQAGVLTAERILDQEVADLIRDALYEVVENERGTGKRARISGVRVGGKTGTAHKVLTEGVGYDPERVIASFIGFVDARPLKANRRLLMLVLVDEPQGDPRWGGVVAAPVFRAAMERVLSHIMTLNPGQLRTAAVVGSDPSVS